MINQERLLSRFLSYVQVDTTARDGQPGYPSSPGQLELGRILRDELLALGVRDALQTKHGIVLGTIGSNVEGAPPAIAFNAHVDTSPETTGANVRPQVIRNYQGGDIPLPQAGLVIRVSDNPELKRLSGRTLITSDGTTLLGADDKSGVAVIMELAATLQEHPEIAHGPLCICFTCDEEIGHGVDHVDLAQLGAHVCYTLDGSGVDEIDVETFSADLAEVVFHGVNIHPSIAKGRMINALRAAGDFLNRLPRERLSPETTSGREGFLHPYQLEGGVAEARLRIILRDFDTAKLAELAGLLRSTAADVEHEHPGAKVDINVTPQYRNMAAGLRREPRAAALAQQALERLGRTPRLTIIRGGTDGSQFTERGLPTPNLSTGEHNPHSPLEWTCLEEMASAVEMLVKLVELWSRQR